MTAKQVVVIDKHEVPEGVLANEALKGKKNGVANSEAPLLTASDLAYDDIIKRYASIALFGWWELGEAVKMIKDRNLWEQYEAPRRDEPFHSFEDYINRRGQKSRTSLYRAYQLRTGLTNVAESDCRNMSQANAMLLLHLVKMLDEKKALTPKVIGAALSMQEEEFEEFCNELLPGAAATEEKEAVNFKCDKSLAKVVKKALQVAMWDAEVDDKNGALERIVTYYLDGKCEHESMHKLSNREAYQANKGKKRTEEK